MLEDSNPWMNGPPMVPMRRVWDRKGDFSTDTTAWHDREASKLVAADNALNARPDSRKAMQDLFALLAQHNRLDRATSLADRWASRDALDVDVTALSWPFGAQGAREREIARREGYAHGFTVAGRWTGDPLAIPRHPVYLWSPPLPALGVLAPLDRAAGAAANRCAVGTSLLRGARRDATRSTSPPPAIATDS